jgi:hypothetical protein
MATLMRRAVFILFMALCAAVGTTGFGLAGTERATKDQSTDLPEAVGDHVPGFPLRPDGETFLLAQQDKKFKCVEQCTDIRSSCEKAANAGAKPGTQQNWEASAKCQGRYVACLDRCE